MQQDDALHTLLVDSTSIRVHQHGSGAQKNGLQCLSRSRSRLTTKLHAVGDAQDRPGRLRLSLGRAHDAPQARALLYGSVPQVLITDRAYDSDALVAELMARGIQVVIPPRCKRHYPRPYDQVRYAQRHSIARLFSRLKRFRRVATRYDKLDCHLLAFAHLAATVLWLRDSQHFLAVFGFNAKI